MSAIKDLTDLAIKLLESEEAKKFQTEIVQLHALAASIQSEHAAIKERNSQLVSENCALKRTIAHIQDRR